MRVYFANANAAFLHYANLCFANFKFDYFFLIWLKAPKPLPHQGACYMKNLLLFQGEKRILLQV